MLKSITVHGFKSFPERIKLELGPGITGIVGPNGCGKSNLGDAIRWVLGERNPRVLRSERLSDVIFSGASSRKAMGQAEVRLLLDEAFCGAETEVVRRLTRDGVSEYRINGDPCRLKDVVDLFSGTGLSHAGYAVIGQGSIHDLVGGRPEDRKLWIEEASGAAKVRLDRQDIEQKIEKARASMARLDDLLLDLCAQKAALDEDRQVARAYLALSEKRKDVELAAWLHQAAEEKKALDRAESKLAKARKEREEALKAEPALKAQVADLTAKRERLSATRREIMASRQKAAGRLFDLEKRREQALSEIRLLRREITARIARKEALEKDLERAVEEERELGKDLEDTKAKDAQAHEHLERARAQRAEYEERWKGLSEKVLEARGQVAALTARLGSWQRKRDQVSRDLEGVEERIREQSQLFENARKQIVQKEAEIKASRSLIREKEEDLARVRESVAWLEREALALEKRLLEETSREKGLEKSISALTARKRLLQEMEKRFEGYSRGPRGVLLASSEGHLSGVLGPVSGLLAVDEKYISALSAIMGGTAENIVVETPEDAQRAIDYLKLKKGGRATFLPLPLLKARYLNDRAKSALARFEGIIPFAEIASCRGNVSGLIPYLLGNVVLADTFDTGLRFMKACSHTARVVTLKGETMEPGGSITGGDAPRHEPLFRRRTEIGDLERKLRQLSEELATARGQREKLQEDLKQCLARLSSAKQQFSKDTLFLEKTKAQDALARSAKRAAQQSVESACAKREALERKRQHLEDEKGLLLAQEREISDGIDVLHRQLEEGESAMRNVREDDENALKTLRELSARKQETERKLFGLTGRIDSLSGLKVALAGSLGEESKEISRLEAALGEANLIGEECAKEIQVLDTQVKDMVTKLADTEEQEHAAGAALLSVADSLKQARRDIERAEVRIAESVEESESVRSALFDTCNLLLSQFGVEDHERYEGPRIPRARGLKMLEDIDGGLAGMGNVNLKAEEQYKEVSDRIGYLSEEKEDIEMAMRELVAAKTGIEQEIKRRFTDTFEKIADSFEKVFVDLFGGGRGTLSLVEGTHGVQVCAQPPGRKQVQIDQLSGGERALCGIALIFAVISVKPSPLIVLDEADTALDEANIIRFSRFLKRYSSKTQFLIITHQKATMEVADTLYGVTMEEPGVSKVFSMRLDQSEGGA